MGVPFIFANFNGTKHDVEVFTHEMGHAYQAYQSRHQPLLDYLWPTYESCEIHSMGLEFLTWPHMEQFFEGDAERFDKILVEYQKAPGVTRERLYLDMMQSVLGNSSKVLVDQKSSSLLYLPLDQLVKQATQPSSSAPDATTPTRIAPPPDASMPLDGGTRSREALRNREGR